MASVSQSEPEQEAENPGFKPPFTKQEAENLAACCGFRNQFGLRVRLNEVGGWLYFGSPPRVRRAEFEELANQAGDILERLYQLSANDKFQLRRGTVRYLDLIALCTELRRLQLGAQRASRALPPPKRGRRFSGPLYRAARALREIYIDGTGRRDVVTRSEDGPSGNYFTFLKGCLDKMYVRTVKGRSMRLSNSRVASLAVLSARNIDNSGRRRQ